MPLPDTYSIYMDGEDVPFDEAERLMTPEWINEGNYSIRTMESMISLIRKVIEDNQVLSENYKRVNEVVKNREENIKHDKDVSNIIQRVNTYFEKRGQSEYIIK